MKTKRNINKRRTSAKRKKKNPKLDEIPLTKSEIITFYELLTASIIYGNVRSFQLY